MIYHAQGFFLDLPPLPDAVESVKEMSGMDGQVYFPSVFVAIFLYAVEKANDYYHYSKGRHTDGGLNDQFPFDLIIYY